MLRLLLKNFSPLLDLSAPVLLTIQDIDSLTGLLSDDDDSGYVYHAVRTTHIINPVAKSII